MRKRFSTGDRLRLCPGGYDDDKRLNEAVSSTHERGHYSELFVENVTFLKAYENYGTAIIIDADGRKRLCNIEDLRSK